MSSTAGAPSAAPSVGLTGHNTGHNTATNTATNTSSTSATSASALSQYMDAKGLTDNLLSQFKSEHDLPIPTGGGGPLFVGELSSITSTNSIVKSSFKSGGGIGLHSMNSHQAAVAHAPAEEEEEEEEEAIPMRVDSETESEDEDDEDDEASIQEMVLKEKAKKEKIQKEKAKKEKAKKEKAKKEKVKKEKAKKEKAKKEKIQKEKAKKEKAKKAQKVVVVKQKKTTPPSSSSSSSSTSTSTSTASSSNTTETASKGTYVDRNGRTRKRITYYEEDSADDEEDEEDNMGTTVVGRAIEVQWGQEWYTGNVTDFRDNQHCVKYNNGEVEWVTLYKHFDNGVTWQLLPQNMRIKPVESSPMMMLPSSSNDNRPSQQQQQQRASLVKTAPLAPGNNWAASNRQWRKYHGVKFEHGMYHAVLKLPRSFTKSTTVVSNTTTNVLPKLPSSSTSSITSTSLGFYDTAIEAAVAYDRGARIRWGAESNASGGNGGNSVPLNFQPWERPLENTELFRRDCDSSTDSRNSNSNVHTARSTNAKRQRTSTTINITTGADTTTTTTSVAGGAKAGAAANHSVSFSSTTATKRRAVSSPVQGVGTDSSRKSHSSPIAVGLFRPASKSPIGMMKGRSRHRLCSSPNLDIASPIAD